MTSGGIPAAKLATAPTAADPGSPKAGNKPRGPPQAQRDALAAVEVESEDEGDAPVGGEQEG